MAKITIIRSARDYPHGAFMCNAKTFSEEGEAPKIHPKHGMIIQPSNKSQKAAYPQLAENLLDAMWAAIPAEKWSYLQVELNSTGNRCVDMASHLSLYAFVLSEYVDPEHPLLKIATLYEFSEFKKAVNALAKG
jgi:hypothetical protein